MPTVVTLESPQHPIGIPFVTLSNGINEGVFEVDGYQVQIGNLVKRFI